MRENSANSVEIKRWNSVVVKAQLLMAGFVFAIEIVNNMLLYVTRSQGYGPDTIIEKLIRYLLVTTIINFGLILFGQIYVRKTSKDEGNQKFVLMLCTILICTCVAYSHYQFSSVLIIFIIPQLICILYEDMSLAISTLLMSLVGQTVGIAARAMDPVYRKDIGPEAAISYSFTISVYIIAKIIQRTLEERRHELGSALVETEKANANAEKARLSFKMLEILARAIDAKDKYTNGHSIRVASYATILAEELGFSSEEIETLRYEALLHDIGKIGVPDSVLNKPGRLSDTEFDIIKSHAVVGAEILKDMVVLPNANSVARYHHERYDGKGYPSGVIGEEIPLNARIVCIADSYDAMSSDRIYRKALSEDIIREELVKGRGTQFDPELLDVFLKLFEEHKLVIKKSGEMSISDISADDEYVLEDINSLIMNIAYSEEHNSSYINFEKFYKYMRNIGIRYNRTIEVLSIKMIKQEDAQVCGEDYSKATASLEAAIRKNIRSVDVHYKYSDTQFMVILLDAGRENIDVITKRITYDFTDEEKFRLVYELNEKIKVN